MNTVFRVLIGLGLLFLASCTGMRDSVVDHVVGAPVSHVVSDAKAKSEEYEQEQHEERVEELSEEYEEFLRSRESVGTDEKAEKQSVVIKQEDNKSD